MVETRRDGDMGAADPVQGPDLDLTGGDQDPGLTEDQGAGAVVGVEVTVIVIVIRDDQSGWTNMVLQPALNTGSTLKISAAESPGRISRM